MNIDILRLFKISINGIFNQNIKSMLLILKYHLKGIKLANTGTVWASLIFFGSLLQSCLFAKVFV